MLRNKMTPHRLDQRRTRRRCQQQQQQQQHVSEGAPTASLLVTALLVHALLITFCSSLVDGGALTAATGKQPFAHSIAKRELTDPNVTATTTPILSNDVASSSASAGTAAVNSPSNSSVLNSSPMATTTTALATNGASPPSRLPPPRVKLNKCCHFGEYLDNSQACVAGSTEHWLPLIYLINRKQYYSPQGSSPKHMTFEENSRPIHIASDATSHHQQAEEEDGCSVNELELFTGSSNLVLFSNGSLFVSERAQLIEPRRYCIDHETALVCYPKDKRATNMESRVKLKKCCGTQFNYEVATKSCKSAKDTDGKLHLPLAEESYQTVYGFPKCTSADSSYLIVGDWQDAKLHRETAVLQLHQKNLSLVDFCLEHLLGDAATHQQQQAQKERLPTVKVFACTHHYAPEGPVNSITGVADDVTDKLQVAALNIGIVVSVVFLAATLIAGYLMPSVHHVLHWRCQIYYVACLFIGDLLLAYTQLSSSIEMGAAFCLFLASSMHFFFLSAFFWLNTMCFNIWWTFRDFRPSSLERNQELLRLRLYSAYAWGIPLLITTVAACVDRLQETTLLRPGFGVRSCWFSGEYLSIFAYFFGPVGLLLCANIILFISTTHQLTCGLWKRDDVKSTTEKTALVQVCLKLVIVMGVTWIADIISWLIGGPHSVWFFTDLINALQGVFIFIVVGCQPQVWSACKRVCCPRSRQEITNTTNGVQHSSSSQGLPSMAGCGVGGAATGGGGGLGESSTHNTSLNTTIGGGGGNGDTTATAALSTTTAISNAGNLSCQSKIPMETVC